MRNILAWLGRRFAFFGWQRMRITTLALIAAASPLLTTTAATADDQRRVGPPLWLISDDDSDVWLLGSVHMLPTTVDWRQPAIEAAFDAASIVYFEVSTDATNAGEIQQLALAHGVNPPGVTMTADLSEDARERLERVALKIGRNLPDFDGLRPWLAYLLLETGLFMTSGASPQYGVDAVLQDEARAAGKTLRFFETAADQVKILSELPYPNQIELLEGALEAHEEQPDLADKLLGSWLTGDDATLADVVFEAEAEFPLFFDAMFHRRNKAWLFEIERLLSEAGTALIVVGAGHLVGDDGVPVLLAEKGWRVERR